MPITSSHLKAVDLDSAPDELMYIITPPSNGRLELVSAPGIGILNFTQKLIDMEEVLFVHTGLYCKILNQASHIYMYMCMEDHYV